MKNILPMIPVLGAILTYWKQINARLEWANSKKLAFGGLGTVFWVIDVLPTLTVSIFHFLVVLSSIAYYAFIPISETYNTKSELQQFLYFNYKNYQDIFWVWLMVVIIGYLNLISVVLRFLASLLPKIRYTTGYANASWHIDLKEKASVIAISPRYENTVVDDVLLDLTGQSDNQNLALRPDDLDDDEAANILFFGHIIENSFTRGRIGSPHIIWGPFYELLGQIARESDHPFASSFICNHGSHSSFYYEIQGRYETIPDKLGVSFPNSLKLEQELDSAFDILRRQFSSDARNIAVGILRRASYKTCLRNGNKFGWKPEISRQFAKLTVIWRFVPKIHRPTVFVSAYSRRILVFLLERNFLVTDATEFNIEDTRLTACYIAALHRFLLLSYERLETSRRPQVTSWRDKKRTIADIAGIDWEWYVYYRVDQHVFHLARELDSEHWKLIDGLPLVRRSDT